MQAMPNLPSTAVIHFCKAPSRPGPSNLGVNKNKRQRDIPPHPEKQLPGRITKQDLASLESQVGQLYETFMTPARVIKKVVKIREPPVSPTLDRAISEATIVNPVTSLGPVTEPPNLSSPTNF